MYDFKKVEEDALNLWEDKKIYPKTRALNKGKKKFYFLDGPPYTSGRVHIGTAWNKALKDMTVRFKRMSGFDVWDRAGYDMHGLPTEHKVEKKFSLKTKEDIARFGVARFVQECEKFSVDNMHQMNKDFRRLGVWLDFDNAYQPVKKDFIEGVWFFIKEAHKKERLYEGNRSMSWCASCATALAKHELEYETVTDNSIYLKFKVKGSNNEYLIVWTTTPWTIPFNMAVMVNPEVTYVKAKVGGEVWIVAESLAKHVVEGTANEKLVITKRVLGQELADVAYEHPFQDILPQYKELQKTTRLHYIVISKDHVDITTGSGLVHCAPGCGPEDYEVGTRYKLPIFNTLDEYGIFPHDMGPLKDLKAKTDDKQIIEILKEKGALVKEENVSHEYAHCQRCHSPIIYKTTRQWFLKVEDLKDKILKDNTKIQWVPDAAFNAFQSWLSNLRDNSITKQRYWGTPLPIWRCTDCTSTEIFGSVKELEQRAKCSVRNLHKPWIDEVTFPCKECKYPMKRLPDVIDVWVDAGCAAWNALDYPQREDLMKKFYPADVIIEGIDQIRGWFNLLMVTSKVLFGIPSFKAAYMHGFINDALGRKMSKSLGNFILPEEVIEKYGADTLRYYVLGAANPGVDLNYNFEDMKLKYRNLGIVWNISRLLLLYAPYVKQRTALDAEEQYIFSYAHTRLKKATECMNDLKLNEVPIFLEEIFLELSRSYIQYTREKINEEPEKVATTIFKVFFETLKAFSIVCPFIAEAIYQDLRKPFKLPEESIHLYAWPQAEEKKINKKLEEKVGHAKVVIQEMLSQREKEKIGIRWPLGKVTVSTSQQEVINALNELNELVLRQTNVKKIQIIKKKEGETEIVLDTAQTPELEAEGFARELARRIQDLRKKQGLNKEDKILLAIDGAHPLKMFAKHLQTKVGAKELLFGAPAKAYAVHSTEKIRDKSFDVHMGKA